MLRGRLSGASTLAGSIAGAGSLAGSLMTNGRVYPTYEGATTVTPSETAQVLATEGRAVLTDITIDPIPSNYGRIEQRGASLRVY